MVSSDKRFIPEIRCEQSYDKAISQMSEIISSTTASLDSIFDHDWIDILVKNSSFFDTIADFKIKQRVYVSDLSQILNSKMYQVVQN